MIKVWAYNETSWITYDYRGYVYFGDITQYDDLKWVQNNNSMSEFTFKVPITSDNCNFDVSQIITWEEPNGEVLAGVIESMTSKVNEGVIEVSGKSLEVILENVIPIPPVPSHPSSTFISDYPTISYALNNASVKYRLEESVHSQTGFVIGDLPDQTTNSYVSNFAWYGKDGYELIKTFCHNHSIHYKLKPKFEIHQELNKDVSGIRLAHGLFEYEDAGTIDVTEENASNVVYTKSIKDMVTGMFTYPNTGSTYLKHVAQGQGLLYFNIPSKRVNSNQEIKNPIYNRLQFADSGNYVDEFKEKYGMGKSSSQYPTPEAFFQEGQQYVDNAEITTSYSNEYTSYECTIYGTNLRMGQKVRITDDRFGIDKVMKVKQVEWHIDSEDSYYTIVSLSETL